MHTGCDEIPWKNPKSRVRGNSSQAWARFNEVTRDFALKIAAIRERGGAQSEQDRACRNAFNAYLPQVWTDVQRIARSCARKKSPPKWVDFDDLVVEVADLLWFYMVVRRDSRGVVGFDFAQCNSPGVWLRWKVTRKFAKRLSQLRGENQNTRKADTKCMPEHLSRTGELPDEGRESDVLLHVEARRELGKLEGLCKTAREFAIVQALSQAFGDERRIVAFLIERKVYAEPAEALREVDAFVDAFAKKKIGAQLRKVAA